MTHGGDLAEADRRFGVRTDGWIDLSTGINPWPYPHGPPSAEAMARLPSSAAADRLIRAASEYCGAPRVLPVPGAQAAIQHLPHCLAPRDVAVVGPTYAEHGRCWAAAGHRVRNVSEPVRAAVLVVVNPNNPDGRRWTPAHLRGLDCGLLVVDESFADSEPGLSLAPDPDAVVLRSFGKFFGLAGLRLGFALGPDRLLDRLRTRLGPWAVSGPALEIGAAAYRDTAWIRETRRRLRAASERLDGALARIGLETLGGTALFRFARGDGGAARFAGQGLWVREFPDLPGRLRFGLPPNAEAWDRLSRA